MQYLYYLVLPLVIAFLSTPLVSQVARRNGVMDKPGLHKTHQEAKPLLGGLSIFLAVTVAVFALLPASPAVLSLMGGGTILVITGLLDDIFNLKPVSWPANWRPRLVLATMPLLGFWWTFSGAIICRSR